MPRLELTERELIIHLSYLEALFAFHRSIRIPLAKVRGATDDDGYSGSDLGLRLPGTYLPGVIAAGTYFNKGDKQFVYITRRKHPVVIELAGERWSRVVVGVDDGRADALRINAALKPS